MNEEIMREWIRLHGPYTIDEGALLDSNGMPLADLFCGAGPSLWDEALLSLLNKIAEEAI